MRYLGNKDSIVKIISEITLEEKLTYATDGENGLWMCQNHHKMFDSNILLLSENGKVSFIDTLSGEDIEYVNSITTVSTLPQDLITPSYVEYLRKRYETVQI